MHKAVISLVITQSVLVASESPQPKKIATEVDAQSLVESAMNLFSKGNHKEGFDLLSPYWKIPSNEIDTLLMQTIAQRSVIKARYGESLGFELVLKQKAGNSFLRFVYIEKLQNTALRYTFIFYRPKDSWEIQGVLWDDKINLLFGE